MSIKHALILIVALFIVAGLRQNDPAAANPHSQSNSCTKTHTIKQGDTPGHVAKLYGITVDAMWDVNKHVTAENPTPIGDRICLPDSVMIEPPSVPAPVNVNSIVIPGTRNGSFQPPQNVVNLVDKHFGDLGQSTVIEALTIARCESSYRVDVHRGAYPHTGDFGLFQINYIHDQPGELLPSLGYTRWDMLKGDNNVRVARALYDMRVSKGQHKWADWKQSNKCHNL